MNGAVVMRSVYAPQDEEDDTWEQTAVINGIMTARKLVDMVSNDAFVDWQQWRKEDTIGDIDRLRSADVSRPTEVWICPDTLSNEWGAVTLRNNEMLTVTNQPHTLSLLLCFAPDALICVEISGGAEENDYSAHVPRYTKEDILHKWGDKAYSWDTANLPDTLDWVRSDVIFGDTAEKILRNYIVYDGDGGDPAERQGISASSEIEAGSVRKSGNSAGICRCGHSGFVAVLSGRDGDESAGNH